MGVAYLWLAIPTYESTVELLVDPRPRQVVDANTVPTGLGSSSQGADAALVESQVGIITSRSVLGELINRYHLLDDPDFGDAGGGNGSGPVGLVKAALYGPNAASQNALSPEERAMDRLSKAIKVDRTGNTYILTIAAKTASPQKSADLANGIATIYLEEIQRAASQASAESAEFLENRLDELKAEADAALKAVEGYRAENGLISADSLPIGEQQLRDITSQITEASIATGAARADLEEISRLAEMPMGMAPASSALTSTAIDNLRLQLELTRSEEQTLAASLGPRHPSMVRARERRAGIETSLVAEYRRLLAQAESRYNAARSREQSLRWMLTDYEARQATANAASVTLAELERVAASKSALYQTFLSRALEVREQVSSPAGTARTISAAVPSSRPSEPRMLLVLAMAVAVGLAVGTSIAWLQHLLLGTSVPTATAPVRRRPVSRPAQAAAPHQPASPARPKVAQPRPTMAGLFR